MQQQLAALLSSALPKEDSTTSSSSSSSSLSTPSSSSSSSSAPVSSSSSTLKQVPGNETDESARLAAINSLHRAILYPPNSLLVSHSASFLSQGLSQLLNDKLYSVRQAAATAYGALCAIVCSILLTSNRRQNHVVLGSMVDRYIGWALPLLKTGDTTAELALDSLREFLNVGDVNGIERYALPILKACQQLLEDERTSLSLLHRLLGVLTLISLKFFRCFQPHFLDIVDLLLGWALVPDLAESDRRIIMDCFLQFQKHWVASLQFSHGLLSKFLDDMDALLHDGSPGNQQQFKRLLALLSCFSTVLRSTASGLLEISLLEQISEPLCLMLPRLLGCLSMVGHKFGWSKWAGDLWKCLTLLAEILCEKFSVFYPLAVDTLFQSLEVDGGVPCVRGGKIASVEVHEVLKTNLQLLSLQKLGLLPSSVQKVLQFDAPISQLRLHPNHIVTASSAATYVFLLQHGNGEVVQQTKDLLLAELELLKRLLEKVLSSSNEVKALDIHSYSKSELFALIKFDLKVLLTCVFLGGNSSSSLIGQPDLAILYLDRSEALLYFIVENLNPFHFPIKDSVELQVNIMTTLEKLSRVELLSKCASHDYNQRNSSVNFPAEKAFTDIALRDSCMVAIMEHLRKYSELLVKALHVSSPLEVKVVALKWVQSFCKQVLEVMKHLGENSFFFEPFVYSSPFGNIYSSILDGASDREPKVRLQVASILELLLQAKLVHPADFYFIGQRILEKLGDPNNDMRNAFVRLLSHAMPIFIYSCGLCEYGMAACMPNHREHNCLNLHWKQLFALKQLPQQLSAAQLVAILSYISQRWKVPLSTWIKRLIHSCRRSKDHVVSQHEETGNFVTGVAWLEAKLDEDVLENICSVNVLAGAWWAIQEAARYCIATRLRTNLGGPSQTFAALERMLLDVAHVMQLDSEQNDGSLSIINSSGAHILPMRLLLDFVEALKKNVYNAYEGSAVLPSVSRQSSLFFRANKKVCEDWFSRICEPMMNAGLALQCHYATIEYCTLRLHDVQSLVNSALKDKSRSQVLENLKNVKSKFSGEVLRVLRHLALAMCRCYEPEALVGLQTWVSKTFSSLLIEDYHPVDHAGDFRPLAWINGLVYQAQGQYEKAAAHFTHLLQSEESLNLMGSDGVQFAIARIIESYSAVSDWKSLESWLLELQMLRAKHAGKSYSGALTTAGNEINAILALAHFDQGEFQAAWTCLDLTPKSSNELALDPKVAFQRSEQMLLQALLLHMEGKVEKVPLDLQKAKLMLEEELSVLPLDGLVDSSAYAIQLHCISALEDGITPGVFQDGPRQIQSLFGSYVHPVKYPISKMHQDCYPWSKVLRVYRSISPTSPVTLSLGMNLLALARKQKNLLLGNRLSCYLREHLYNCPEEMIHSSLPSNLEYEEILLKYAHNDFEGAFTSLWSFLRPCVISPVSIVPYSDDSILKAKACLKLSKWLKGDYSDLCVEIIVPRIQEDLKDVDFSFPVKDGKLSINENLIHKQSISLITEEIVGMVAKLSTHLCPIMGKSWISYASWCFGQARNSMLNLREAVLQCCTFSSSLVSEVQPDRFRLNEDEATKLKSIALKLVRKMGDAPGTREIEGGDSKSFDPATMSNDNYVNALVQQVEDIIEDSSGAEASGGQCLSTSVASRLQTFFLHLDMDVEKTDLASIVDELINIWWSLRRRRVSLFGHAAYGFIQYLSHAASKGYNDLSMGSGYESLKHRAESLTLRATLYVLHILLNYGVELQDNLEPSLSSVPLLSWQEVIPQLFARLSSHPEQVVRRQLEGLLIMLGNQSPWSIVYPTLLDVNANEEKPSEELQHILASLRELHPRLVQDVQLMMNELSNVTVLWEELWLSTLQDLHADVMRRIHVLKEESARIAENVALSQSEKNKINAARYSAMMAPIIVTLERRLASTSRKPETPHELWFCEQYSEQLKSAIFIFKTPPRSAAALGEVWRPFDIITASLASYQRKSSVSLGEVAPQLALLSSSDVPMPGLEKQGTLSNADGLSDKQDIVTISSFSEQVAILSTKTKPKKIVMMGSDGRNYTYLLKGREDLRLDARIMQLLQAVNGLLGSCPTTRGRLVGIRYYSVTPISGRAGLIQWVDNVISIYTVFRCWQTRAQSAQLSSSGNGNTKSSVPPVPRPNDMFYGKIIPALKEKGIRRVISRRDWPQEVKLKVLLDLMKEIPRQLLYLELWCASDGFKEFSLKLKRYSGSVAAMSMVGHILGLGDRHLDNILVDFGSGDIVHIDYNICFDKGQRLKIPEIVPFRLTQMIEAALGLAGVEGTFRANCEAVMDVLRKNKDIILMLLEVFVWDPLVEWTRGDFHDDAAIGGEERKGMELAVSLSLFASRVQEIRASLQEHHDLLLSTLPAVESALEKFADILSKYEHVSALFCRVDEERSNLIMHETSAKSIVAEATCTSEKVRQSFEIQAQEFSQAKALVAEKAQEAMNWLEQHGRILEGLRDNLFTEIKGWIELGNMGETLSLIRAVPAAGVPISVVPEPTKAQCLEIDREVCLLVADLDHGVSSSLTAIHVYSLALQRILPLNYVTTSKIHGWAQVLQLCSNVLSSDVLSLARRQASDLISNMSNDTHDASTFTHNDLCLKMDEYASNMWKLEEECAELVNSLGMETESKAKDRLLSSFMKYTQLGEIDQKEGSNLSQAGRSKHDSTKSISHQIELIEKREEALFVLNSAVTSLYADIKSRTMDIGDITKKPGSSTIISELEEQVEKLSLISSFQMELQQLVDRDTHGPHNSDHEELHSKDSWPSIFQSILGSSKSFIDQMAEIVLPDVMRIAISFNSEVLDTFGSISQVRGAIDTALEQLMEVEMERESLVELEQNYFVRVGLITEQQLALKEAAVKGRDHLSWEEAEELASQEEACRAQLDLLHQTWNQRDKRTSTLFKREAEVKNSLISSEKLFHTLAAVEQDVVSQVSRSKALLASLIRPFSELESFNRVLSSMCGTLHAEGFPKLVNLLKSGYSVSECIWKVGGSLSSHAFFIWKLFVVDAFLDSCIQDVALSADQSLGFDQLLNVLKKKIVIQLEKLIGQYLKEYVLPILVVSLELESERLKQLRCSAEELGFEIIKKDTGAVQKVKYMLEEFCNAHETARAARSVASLMKRQVNELKEAICKTGMEIVKMEWMHDALLTTSQNSRVTLQKFLSSDDDLRPIVTKLSRSRLLEVLHSAVSRLAQSVESLQTVERTTHTAEAQLERAMGWACGGPSSSVAGNTSGRLSGIPPQFHEHLMRRRQLLWDAREKASKIAKICMSILEFEASRDGILWVPGERAQWTSNDHRAWQQAYFSSLTRLEVAYHAFSRVEQEWNLAQSSMEAASNGLYSATSELCIASVKAKSASDDLHNTVLSMRDCAYEARVALSAFCRVMRGHTALTSECSSMLEEVLAVTEDLHDVHSLGKEAASVHRTLMDDLAKAGAILLPLESVLSKDVAAMTEAISRERESKMGISPIHGQAIYQSYCSRVREACQALEPLLPSLLQSVKDLLVILTRLARTASLHAGNLHKALEGVGESQEEKSEGVDILRPDFSGNVSSFDEREGELSVSDEGATQEILEKLSLPEKAWLSPPDSICNSSSESSIASSDADFLDSSSDQKSDMVQQLYNFDCRDESGHPLTDFSSQADIYRVKTSDSQTRCIENANTCLEALVISEPLPCTELVASQADEHAIVPLQNSCSSHEEDSKMKHRDKDKQFLDGSRYEDENNEDPELGMHANGRVARGKNAYAISVLRRVEMKLDGRDISDTREISVAEQVDYLLKQATSVDNLCNMYEGWTPWI